MKTTKLIILFILTFAFIYAFTGCGKKESEVKDDKQKTEMKHDLSQDTAKIVKDGTYFCPMHPLIQANEPAKCPECKMDLITKKEHYDKMQKKHEELESKNAGKSDAVHFEVKTSALKSWECENVIKKALKNTPGVMDFSIDILENKIHLYIDKSKTTKKDVEKAIADLGFDANDLKANQDALGKLPAECK